MIAWFQKYKPTKIEDYVFYDENHKLIVNKWIENSEIDGNLLLYGPPGVGKTALSELLISYLIKHEYDLKVIKSRSVNQIDELFGWCQTVPFKSKKKIVYIEEFDKLSSTAFTSMKDSLLEKFQENVSFICNTNFINKINSAIISRFNYKFNLNSINLKENIFNRLKFILDNENISYNEVILKNFVERNYTKGLRNLITSIQIGSISKILNLENINNIDEYEIVNLTTQIYSKLLKSNNKKEIIINPLNSEISEEYTKLLNIIYYNQELNWDNIFIELESKINFIPIKVIISEFIETLNNKKLPHVHYIAFLYKSMMSLANASF